MAGGGAAFDRQHRRGVRGEVVEMNGIAVDRGVVARRHVARRHHRLGKDAAMGGGERHALAADHRGGARLDEFERRCHRQQLAAEGEAVIAQLRHLTPPAAGNGR
jgi:hypothetical protein